MLREGGLFYVDGEINFCIRATTTISVPTGNAGSELHAGQTKVNQQLVVLVEFNSTCKSNLLCDNLFYL